MPLDDSFYAPPIGTLADAQAMAIEQINAILARVRDLGVIVDDLLPSPPAANVVFASDADSHSQIWTTFHALETGALSSTWWQAEDGDWYELSPSSSDDFAGQAACCVVSYVAACEDNAAALKVTIEAAASINAVLAVDLSAGWPSRTCAEVTLPMLNPDDALRLILTQYHVGGVVDDQVIAQWIIPNGANPIEEFPRSQAFANTAPAAEIVFDITLEGFMSLTVIGTITFAAGEQWGTVDITYTDHPIGRQQVVKVVAPTGSDATIADISITFDWPYVAWIPPI